MRSASPSRPRLRRLLLALFCALGLVGRLAAPVIAMPAMAASLLLESGICHAASGDEDGSKPPGHNPDCQFCPDCHAVAHFDLLPVPSAAVPLPTVWASDRIGSLFEATGPPAAPAPPFHSRAPPAHSA